MKFLAFLSSIVIALLAFSCQKVIDIDIAGNEPVLVIESYMEEDSLCFVQLSTTIDIFDGQIPRFIEDATITIMDDLGNQETLLPYFAGRYYGVAMRGEVGRTYTLSVSVDGKQYQASSSLLPVVPIDSIRIEEVDTFGFFVSDYRNVRLHYTDPSTTQNAYLAKFVYAPNPNNNEAFFLERKYLLNDNNQNGLANSVFLFSQPLESGDVIVAELRSIDQAIFDYYFSIEDALTGNSFTSAAPANPITNWSNGALGYFGAWSKSVELFVVP
ncbi:MAG: DUF4249 domain-containing protein [Aureispira sp.]